VTALEVPATLKLGGLMVVSYGFIWFSGGHHGNHRLFTSINIMEHCSICEYHQYYVLLLSSITSITFFPLAINVAGTAPRFMQVSFAGKILQLWTFQPRFDYQRPFKADWWFGT